MVWFYVGKQCKHDNNRLKVNLIRLEICWHPIAIWEFPPSPASLKAGAGWAELAAGSDPYLVSWWKFRSPKFGGLIVRSYDQCWSFYNSLFLQVQIGYRVFLIEWIEFQDGWFVGELIDGVAVLEWLHRGAHMAWIPMLLSCNVCVETYPATRFCLENCHFL